MDHDEMVSLLGKVEIFDHVETATLQSVAGALEERAVPAGTFLFRENDPGGFVFLVAAGALEVRKTGEGSADVFLRIMGPGEVGGLTSTALDRVRSASLKAREDALVLTLASDAFLKLLGDHADLVRSVLAHLGSKVRGKSARLAALMARDRRGTGEPVAFFDTKSYDRIFFDALAGDDITVQYLESRLRPETAGLASGFRVVCAFVNDDLGAETVERLAAGGVELIALRSAGFNHVDLAATERHGITVVRVPGYSPHAVAEHTVALILSLDRKIHRAYQRVREGNFSLGGLVGFDLRGRTAGVVGLGKIGRVLAGILRGFEMEVLGHDPHADEDWARTAGVALVERDELLAGSDIVSLNAPLTPETHHMIDARAIERMKRGVMLVNTGRGALVDTAALIAGLKSGHIGAAGLDVYEEESGTFFEDLSETVITDDVLARLLTFPNVLITSHQAFLTEEALRAIAGTTLDSIRDYLAGKRGEELTNVVTPPDRSGRQAG
jgi:D-lactate dehydrogenase